LPLKIEDLMDEEKRKQWVINKGINVFSLYDVKNPFFLLMFLSRYLLNLVKYTSGGKE
jgi:hypothetical protein